MSDIKKLVEHLRNADQLKTLIDTFLFDFDIEFDADKEYSMEQKQDITSIIADVLIASDVIAEAFGIDAANLIDMKYHKAKRALLNWEAHEKGMENAEQMD